MADQGGSNKGKGKNKPPSGRGPGGNGRGGNGQGNNQGNNQNKPPGPPDPGYKWVKGPGGWYQTEIPRTDGTVPDYLGAPRDGYHWEQTPGGGWTQVPDSTGDGGDPPVEDTRPPAPGAAWQWNGKNWVRPDMPKDGSPYTWDDNLGWQKDTGLMNSRTNARDYMLGLFKQFGFDDADIKSLTTMIDDWVQKGLADAGTDPILMKFRDTDIYKRRFAGMAELISRGQAISEAEYIQLESAYRNTMMNYGLDKEYYDSPADYARLIGAGLSVKEVEERVVAAKQAMNPLVSAELKQYYDITDGDLTAYMLGLTDTAGLAVKSARNQNEIRTQARAAQIGGMAEKYGFGMDKASAEGLGATTMGINIDPFQIGTMSQLDSTFAQARRVANREGTLAAIDQQDYTEQDTLAATFGDEQKRLASEKRAARERARFGGSSAVGGGSLSVSRNL